MREFLYWAGIACALAGLYLSIESLVKEKVKRNRVSEILMTVFCIAAMMIWGIVIYLAVSQLVTWGQCL